jgi:hypothetical protein
MLDQPTPTPLPDDEAEWAAVIARAKRRAASPPARPSLPPALRLAVSRPAPAVDEDWETAIRRAKARARLPARLNLALNRR